MFVDASSFLIRSCVITLKFGNRKEETYEVLVKQQNKYLCYNSFKAKYFWGPKRLSERFIEPKAVEMAKQFHATAVYSKYNERI